MALSIIHYPKFYKTENYSLIKPPKGGLNNQLIKLQRRTDSIKRTESDTISKSVL
ncbi:hypothetical protein HNR69_000527 [Histophilus somni]|nr:hypothetical protein [Histophilus somni]